MAHLALRDTDASMALVSQAQSNAIPSNDWIDIADTLQSQTLKEGQLAQVEAQALIKNPEELLIERVGLIHRLLEVSHNKAAQKPLVDALRQLNGPAGSEPVRYSPTSHSSSAPAGAPLSIASTNATLTLAKDFDPSWALIAQLALTDDNALMVLLSYADKIPSAGWTSMAVTLAGQSLRQGWLEPLSTREPEASLNQRLAVIDGLLAVAPHGAARQSIITTLSELNTRRLSL